MIDTGVSGRAGGEKGIIAFAADSIAEGQRCSPQFGKLGFDLHDFIIVRWLRITAAHFDDGEMKALSLNLAVGQADVA